VLSFNLAYGYRKSFADEFSVLVSTDCGANYQVKYQKAGNALKTADAERLFFPSEDQWQLKTFNLSSWHGDVLIKLRATTANGNNLYIDNMRVENVTDLCTAPTDLDAVQISTSSAKLQWQFHSNAGNANRFDVYYRKKGIVSWTHKIISGNKRWININGLQPDTDYEWYVTATCDSGNSLPSPRSSFTTESDQPGITSSSTALPEEQGLQSQLKIFPNPTNGRTIISFTTPKAGGVSLTIYDVTGRVIKTIANAELNEGDHTFNLDVKNFRAGIYLLRMQSGQISQTRKFIVRH
jgi:hypothetical protein